MLKLILKVGLIFTILTIFSAVVVDISNRATQRTIDNIFYSNFQNILTVERRGNSNAHGTGVVVRTASGKEVVLTNRHVCQMVGPNLFLNNEVLSGATDILYIDYTADLCLISLPKALNLPKIQLAQQAPRLNQQIFSIGYPLYFNKNLVSGTAMGDITWTVVTTGQPQSSCDEMKVKDGVEYCLKREQYMGTNVELYPGGSGSPVFNINNELVGLMSATDQHGSFFGCMVHLKDIKRVLNQF